MQKLREWYVINLLFISINLYDVCIVKLSIYILFEIIKVIIMLIIVKSLNRCDYIIHSNVFTLI